MNYESFFEFLELVFHQIVILTIIWLIFMPLAIYVDRILKIKENELKHLKFILFFILPILVYIILAVYYMNNVI